MTIIASLYDLAQFNNRYEVLTWCIVIALLLAILYLNSTDYD